MQTQLEKVGIEEREETLLKNDFDTNKEYGENAPEAISGGTDDPFMGKGSGSGGHGHLPTTMIDTNNGGSIIDIKGNPNISYSGREGNMLINKYSKGKGYFEDIKIDTTLNKGQVIIE